MTEQNPTLAEQLRALRRGPFSICNKAQDAALDIAADRLEAIRVEVDELATEHQQSADGHGCVMCFPQDGRWPCTSSLIADALTAALAALTQEDR